VRSDADSSELAREVATWFDRTRASLLGYVTSLGLAVEDGEEVIQEVFLALFHHLRAGKPRDNLRGWLFRVAHNLALKRRQRRPAAEANPVTLDEPACEAPNPEQALAERQRRERLLAVVRALPERERCCLHLRAEGLGYREIAQALGISTGSVSIALARALERLSRARASI
jgi:RNA polymerase sigma-70 factor (ECF subfamily)